MSDTREEGFFRTRRWPWILLVAYMALSVTLATVIPASRLVAPLLVAGEAESRWVLSPTMTLVRQSEQDLWRSSGEGTAFASRSLARVPEADSLRLQACRGSKVGEAGADNGDGTLAVMLASVNTGTLDFNRAYRLFAFESLNPGECADETFSRWEGDEGAVLQVQFLTGQGAATIGSLSVSAQAENENWRVLRLIMLPLGLFLVCWLFANYRRNAPKHVVLAGLLVVAGIVFGVSVSVPLKADIYALMTGGRSITASANGAVALDALLTQPFPIGGFSIFTQLHAVFFASACFCLCLVERRAWADLVLLALVSETLQIFVPGRGPGLSDSLVDMSGVAAGLVLVFLVLRSQRVRLLLQH